MVAHHRDGGFSCRSARVTGNNTATAGGTGDNTQVDGAWIDRFPSDIGPLTSAKLIINYTATLTQAATLSFAVAFQDATDSSGTGAATFGSSIASTVVATGPTGGGTVTGTVEIDLSLDGAREFFRSRITPDLSAANTDTAAWSAVVVMFGSDRKPITQAIGRVGYPT